MRSYVIEAEPTAGAWAQVRALGSVDVYASGGRPGAVWQLVETDDEARGDLRALGFAVTLAQPALYIDFSGARALVLAAGGWVQTDLRPWRGRYQSIEEAMWRASLKDPRWDVVEAPAGGFSIFPRTQLAHAFWRTGLVFWPETRRFHFPAADVRAGGSEDAFLARCRERFAGQRSAFPQIGSDGCAVPAAESLPGGAWPARPAAAGEAAALPVARGLDPERLQPRGRARADRDGDDELGAE